MTTRKGKKDHRRLGSNTDMMVHTLLYYMSTYKGNEIYRRGDRVNEKKEEGKDVSMGRSRSNLIIK